MAGGKGDGGFTLLELITVITIVGILTAIAVPQYPASLDALAEEGYLRKIPVDPITQQADWEAVFEELDPDRPGESPGVYDVKSAATEPSLSGTPYNEW